MEKNRKIYEIKSNADLVINYGEDVLNYLYVEVDKENSKLSKEFVSEVNKQRDSISKKLEYKLTNCNKIVLHNKKSNAILTIKNNRFTLWQLKMNNKCRYLDSVICDDIYTVLNTDYNDLDINLLFNVFIEDGNKKIATYKIIQHFIIVFHYYLLNPYIILPAEPVIKKAESSNTNYVAPPVTVINLTSNHHKQKIRQGVNLRDKRTGIITPSIAETARRLKKEYSYFYYDLSHSYELNYERIEKDICSEVDIKPEMEIPKCKASEKIPFYKKLFKRASIF